MLLDLKIEMNRKANYELKSDQYKSNLFECDLSFQTLRLNLEKQSQRELGRSFLCF